MFYKYILFFICFSLNNTSNMVRWTVDLRWQKPDHNVGLWDLKEGVLLRSSKDPDMKINWEAFDSVDRAAEQIKAVIGEVNDSLCMFSN